MSPAPKGIVSAGAKSAIDLASDLIDASKLADLSRDIAADRAAIARACAAILDTATSMGDAQGRLLTLIGKLERGEGIEARHPEGDETT